LAQAILVLNAGSSSLKFALYGRGEDLPLVLKGNFSSLDDHPRLTLSRPGEKVAREKNLGRASLPIGAAMELVAAEIAAIAGVGPVAAVGHRIVHGGREFTSATILDGHAMERLRRLIPLAPIHQPRNLEIVDLAAGFFAGATQVGCFDTAFHATRPAIARHYGLPRALTDSGIEAYGFHGLSYGYIASVLAERLGPRAGGKAIVAHLGSGASLCALIEGRSLATTMGFSPLDGLVMSTRCGALDPGVVLYLIEERGMSPAEVSDVLYHRSGLLGLSGTTGDMRRLLETESTEARQAVDLFVYRAGREIGSLAAALGGLETLVFTAGIGEHAPLIRERIGAAAGWLGVRIDPDRNAAGGPLISAPGSTVDVLVLPTDEEVTVAREVNRLLQTPDPTPTTTAS
jgi:acetate kinase